MSVKINVPNRTVVVEHVTAIIAPEMLAVALNGAKLDARVAKDMDRVSAAALPKWNVIVSGIFWMLSLIHYACLW